MTALSVCLVAGAAQLGRWSSPERSRADRLMARSQSLMADLEQGAQQDQSFRSAYKLLYYTISTVDTIQILQSVGTRVELKPELRLQLESAYLIATARARSDAELRRIRNLEDRYREALLALQPARDGEAGNPEVTRAGSYGPREGSRG